MCIYIYTCIHWVVIVNMTIISPYHIPILSRSSPQQPLPRPPELPMRPHGGGSGGRSTEPSKSCSRVGRRVVLATEVVSFFVKKMGFDHYTYIYIYISIVYTMVNQL